MANYFLDLTKSELLKHGKPATYVRVSSGTYNVETGKKENTETNYTIQIYKKNMKVNQYNYPNLIGKDVSMFYIASDSLSFIPNVRDSIIFDGVRYSIDSYIEHAALGQVVLYKVIGFKG